MAPASRYVVACRRFVLPLSLAAVATLIFRWCGLWPLQRFPNWDWAWIDARSANSLSALRRNIASGQAPSLDLRTNLGFDYVGDAYPIINPLNLLVIFMRPATVIWLRSAIVVIIGCCGAFYWFRRWASTAMAAVAAVLYLSLPYLTSLHLFTTLGTAPFVMPLLLMATEDLIDEVTLRNALRAWLAVATAVVCSDINILLSLGPICVVYGCAYGLIVRGHALRQVGRAVGVAGAVSLAAAAPLLLPLYQNSQSLVAGPALTSFLGTPRSNVHVWSFLMSNGAASLIWPFEGSGLLLYCPPIFVLLGIVGLLIPGRRTSHDLRRRGIALLVLAVALVIETLLVNNGTLLDALGVNDSGARGILRVQLNLLPYIFLMVGVLGCARLVDEATRERRRWPMLVMAGTTMASVAADLILIWIDPRWSGKPLGLNRVAQVPSPTLLRLPRSWSPVAPLVTFHVAAGLLLLVGSRALKVARGSARTVRVAVSLVLVTVVAVGTVTANLEMLSRSSAQWHWVTESSYRFDAFQDRRDCLERLAPVDDPGVRVLYTGRPSLTSGTGRDWANLMEVELAQESGQHTLFSYRELDLPIVGVYYGFFGTPQSALLFPPSTDAIAPNAALLRLLGVRFVVSNNALITNASAIQDFRLLGACRITQEPTSIRGEAFNSALAHALSGSGPSFVYEVARSPGIFGLACDDEVVGQVAALSRASNAADAPWQRGVVLTERPFVDQPAMSCASGQGSSSVQDVVEDGSDIDVTVDAATPVALTIAYAYRSGWSASIDGHDVPVLRAYGGLMAVAVPRGAHNVVLRYRSQGLPVGLTIFGLSGFGLLLGARWRRRQVAGEGPTVDLVESDA